MKVSILSTFAVAAALLIFSDVIAQDWIGFEDERDRLMFNTDDDEEKDLIVGDVDNDGDEDIVVVRKMPFSVDGPRANMLLMNENGNLVDRTSSFVPTFLSAIDNARDVHLFDVNNDGWLDMGVANTFGSLHRLYVNLGSDDTSGDWLGFEDQGDNGEWYSPQLPITPQACGMATGDVNGDGFVDIYYVDYNNTLEARLFINNGDLTFSDETATRLSFSARNQAFGTTAFLADMNGDGAIDIVSNDSIVFGGVGVEIAYNDGNGNFMNTQVLPSITSYMVQMVDMNNDGRMDIYVVDDGQDYVFRNNSTLANGNISVTRVMNTQSSLTQNFNGNVIACDMNNDGFDDMIVSDVDVDIPGCNRRFTLLRNMNGTNFQNPFNNQLQNFNVRGSHDSVVIDINQDGNKDLFIATCSNYHMFVNTAEPTILLGDVNCDGNVNLFDIQPFIDVLSGTASFKPQADLNGDGVANLFDIAGFIVALTG